MDIVKHYTNGDVVIVWKPDLCEHSGKCFRTLPAVFNPRVNPWVQPSGVDSETLVNVITGCPSGALTIQSTVSAQELREGV